MTLARYPSGLDYTDLFCGAGGSSLGLSAAGLELKLAANHWTRAIETHAANFPDAEHLCADVSNYDMRRLPRTAVLWASPICTEVSPAGGRRRRRGQMDLFEQDSPVDRAGFERTRATFWDVIRATEVHRYAAVIVENVVDVVDAWELFDEWVCCMRKLGYNIQYVSVSSAHVGGQGNPHAPQWRDRLYLVFTRTGIPLPDVAPRPLAWCPHCDQDVPARQWWKRPGVRTVGKYRAQYTYRCPNTSCRHAIVEPYVLPAAAAIDWSDLGERIGDRTRPLATKTLARIRAGYRAFAQNVTTDGQGLACPPYLVAVNHDQAHGRAMPAHAAPLPARTARIGDALTCPPMLLPAGGTWNTDPTSVDDPMRTRLANEKGYEALVCPPYLAELRGGGSDVRPVDDPLATVTASGNHHALTVPPGAFYMKYFTARGNDAQMSKDVRTHPLGAITSVDHHALVVPYYRTGRAKTTAAPLDTITTRDRFALVEPDGVDLNDFRLRMIQPREHLRAQRFPDTYVVFGNKGEITMQAGNAVSANVPQWIGTALLAALDGRPA